MWNRVQCCRYGLMFHGVVRHVGFFFLCALVYIGGVVFAVWCVVYVLSSVWCAAVVLCALVFYVCSVLSTFVVFSVK